MHLFTYCNLNGPRGATGKLCENVETAPHYSFTRVRVRRSMCGKRRNTVAKAAQMMLTTCSEWLLRRCSDRKTWISHPTIHLREFACAGACAGNAGTRWPRLHK